MNDASRPIAVAAAQAPLRVRHSIYPEPFATRMLGRRKRPLGDLFGLENFGVNLTELPPGTISALFHAHELQDEFIFVVQGTVTLRTGDARTKLVAGMCAGFRAGSGIAHQLVNESDEVVIYLEIGDRTAGDVTHYPEDDLIANHEGGRWVFTHKDGKPYPERG